MNVASGWQATACLRLLVSRMMLMMLQEASAAIAFYLGSLLSSARLFSTHVQ